MSPATLIARLRSIVGDRHVLTGGAAAGFATGYRTGGGAVAAVVRPATLVEQYRAFVACVAADHIVIAQAANTGLTGGSTPDGDYDRPVVIINTLRIAGIHPILNGEQVVCLSGATLHDLERTLAPIGRETHSVIGSSCIGASVVGGVCNNSGGALVQRGPAYTEYALYARVDANGGVRLVNHLGIALPKEPEAALATLEAGRFAPGDVVRDSRAASAAADYAAIVRRTDAATPARFNADPQRLYEASGSAGRLMVFAVRLDTFPAAGRTAVFYVGTNDTAELTVLRRRLLADTNALPVSGEYIHRIAFDVADRYGKDTVLAIRALGTDRLPQLFRLKDRIDRAGRGLPFLGRHLSDRALQAASRLFPDHLPRRKREYRTRYEHHLILKAADDGIDELRAVLAAIFPSAAGATFECSPEEARAAMLHRFAVAGAAVRYRAVHSGEVSDIVAIDVALRRNDEEWFERLPLELDAAVVAKLYYGHFLCHVFHQDYILRAGEDPVAFEHALLALMNERGAEYPAEHNVGHLYPAKPALAAHYRALDPGNRLNPGIGHTSRGRDWQ